MAVSKNSAGWRVIAGLFALLLATGGQVARAQPSSAAPIGSTPLELTIHMHFRDKYVWREDWPVAKESTRLTGIRLRNVASMATTSSREAFNLMLVAGTLVTLNLLVDLTYAWLDPRIRYR